MKHYSRRTEIKQSCMCIVLGLIGLYSITSYINQFDIEHESVIVGEEIEGTQNVGGEKELQIDIDAICGWTNQPLNEENVRSLLVELLPGGRYLDEIVIGQEKSPCFIEVTYVANQYEQMLSKSRKEQIVLMDASVLMSLYPNIDNVKIKIIVEGETYSKVIYRPDLEHYFGINIAVQGEKNTFERIVGEFTDLENVTAYWNTRQLYDSDMGDEVADFYKMNFPVQHEWKESFPYIDETLGNELVDTYSDKLFLQGLSYHNPLMNDYSANRLIEYYGKGNEEEIMIELAACAIRSEEPKVQATCERIIDLLKPLEEDEIRVFGRFGNSELGGGEKIYRINEDGLEVLASWGKEEQAGLRILGMSEDYKYALCEAKTTNDIYWYIIPCENKMKYQVNSTGVSVEGKIIQIEIIRELSEMLKEDQLKSLLEKGTIQWQWYLGEFIEIKVNEEKQFIYCIEDQILQTKEAFEENFDREILRQGLEEEFDISLRGYTDVGTKAKTSQIVIGDEQILVYEYSSNSQKSSEILQDETSERQITSQKWSKGKLVVFYLGNKQEIIDKLNELMG